MAEKKIVILADDLTGANDTAIQFVKHGLEALVITHAQFPDTALQAAYDVLSLNSESREMNESDAYNTVRDAIKRLKTLMPEAGYYKKLDSVLRGNPGPELAAVLDELDIPLAIAAPSFPANRSSLEHGLLKSGALNVSIDAVKIFASKMNKKVESIPLEKIRHGEEETAEYVLKRIAGGAEVFVADAVIDEDLAIISRLSAALPQPHVLAGSAGLANHIAKSLGPDENKHTLPGNATKLIQKPRLSPDSGSSPVLVIAGTRQGETAAQITILSETLSIPVIRFKTALVISNRTEEAVKLAFEEAARQIKNGGNLCIVAVESMFSSEIPKDDIAREKAESEAISSGLGSLAGLLMESFSFPVIISTGGNTSLELCKRLGIAGIKPLAEICPGIPIGRITGGSFENQLIITKSGRFGNNDTLIEIMNYLKADSG